MINEINNGDKGSIVREVINAMIRKLNEKEASNTDYQALVNKPTINGVALEKDVSLEKLKILKTIDIKLAENNKSFYTKDDITKLISDSYSNIANGFTKYIIVSALPSIEEAEENIFYLIKRTNTSNKTNQYYKYIFLKDTSSFEQIGDESVAQEYTCRDLQGTKDGKNMEFKSDKYILGTSRVYVNGVRFFAGKGYKEADDTTISLSNYIPKDVDELIIEAIFN